MDGARADAGMDGLRSCPSRPAAHTRLDAGERIPAPTAPWKTGEQMPVFHTDHRPHPRSLPLHVQASWVQATASRVQRRLKDLWKLCTASKMPTGVTAPTGLRALVSKQREQPEAGRGLAPTAYGGPGLKEADEPRETIS